MLILIECMHRDSCDLDLGLGVRACLDAVEPRRVHHPSLDVNASMSPVSNEHDESICMVAEVDEVDVRESGCLWKGLRAAPSCKKA